MAFTEFGKLATDAVRYLQSIAYCNVAQIVVTHCREGDGLQ